MVVIQAVVVATASSVSTIDSAVVGLVDGSLDVVRGASGPSSFDAADGFGLSSWVILDVRCVSVIAGPGRKGAPRTTLGLRWIGGIRM